MGRGQEGVGDGEEDNREGETGRRATERRDGDGVMRSRDGERGVGRGVMGRGAMGREGKEVVQAHGMHEWNEVTCIQVFLTLLTCAMPGTPASNNIWFET